MYGTLCNFHLLSSFEEKKKKPHFILLVYSGLYSLHVLFSLSALFPKIYHMHYLFLVVRVFGTSMVEEYDEIADSQYPSERVEYLDEDYGMKCSICFVFNNENAVLVYMF